MAMSENKLFRTARRVSHELSVWGILSSISLGVAISIIHEGFRGILAVSSILYFLANVALLLFGVFWFLVSATLLYNILNTARRYGFFLSLRLKIFKINIGDTIRFVKDVISLYRGYSQYIVFTSILALIVGFSMIIFSIQYYAIKAIGIGELAFKSSIGSIITFYAVLSLYLEKTFMAKRLAEVKSFEKIFSRILEWGGNET